MHYSSCSKVLCQLPVATMAGWRAGGLPQAQLLCAHELGQLLPLAGVFVVRSKASGATWL